jgi:hypothetical protein
MAAARKAGQKAEAVFKLLKTIAKTHFAAA